MEPDFSQMYAELGLQPDCGLEQFKRAYRQRISELHPDRTAHHATPDGRLDLGELIALQAAAIAFHREHGRLPGSTLRHTPAEGGSARSGAAHPRFVGSEGNRPSLAARWPLAAVMLAGALLAGVFLDNPTTEAPPTLPASLAAADAPTQAASEPAEAPSGPLELGMDAATVRSIQGDPMRIDNDTWEYGPSWLRIERNRLVDWHSSPLYRLKTRTPSPDGEAGTTQ